MESSLMVIGAGKVPLRGVEITGEIMAGSAAITVRQRYRNEERRPVEALYTFPLPADAALAGFSMVCQGRRLDAVVKESDAAFRAYDDAINAGHGAALLEEVRPDVFSASVGNLLPDEDVEIEVRYTQRLRLDEGALRLCVPTLVAPRYVPGQPQGDRTGHGVASPTDRVPDADRLTPPIGPTPYGLKVDLVFDLGCALSVESPSHAVQIRGEPGHRTRVQLATAGAALDRDLVLLATPAARAELAATATATLHAPAGGGGPVLAVQILPDLGLDVQKAPSDVVFLIDVSGSMDGASLPAAQTALRLGLRQLRAGDRFNIIAFESKYRSFAPALKPFDQSNLEAADAWVSALRASGGTEILAPMTAAVSQAPDGLILLLTDGQVGNEDEIVSAVAAARKSARVYGFGIGTNVGQGLLLKLARATDGDVVNIFPGERIDDKVVAQLARALAPRVQDLRVSARGFDLVEPAPVDPPALVDGQPWVRFCRLDALVAGEVLLEGTLNGQPFRLSVPVNPSEAADRPALARLWAEARIRALEGQDLTGRREVANRQRIIELATTYGLSSRYTSFIVVEERTGERRSSGMPETRVVPVNAPAGWTMFQPTSVATARPMGGRARLAQGGPVMAAFAPAPAPAAAPAPRAQSESLKRSAAPAKMAPPAPPPPPPPAKELFVDGATPQAEEDTGYAADLLAIQRADGLWYDHGRAQDLAHRAESTLTNLKILWDEGVHASHPVHGAQLKKTMEALAALLKALLPTDPALAERVAAALWLMGGRRVRLAMAVTIRNTPAFAALAALLPDERAVRARLG